MSCPALPSPPPERSASGRPRRQPDTRSGARQRADALFAALALAAASGCSALPFGPFAEQAFCESAEWSRVGRRDGARGDRPRAVEYQQRCDRFGAWVDRVRYEAGYQQGLLDYCTPETGYERGERGRPVRDVCPGALQQDLEEGHRRGVRVYCTAANAFRIGRNPDSEYRGVCPASLEPAFLRHFELGRTVHGFELQRSELEEDLARVERDLEFSKDPEKRRELERERERLRKQDRRLQRKIDAILIANGVQSLIEDL